jgi:hypothetical protein
VAESDINVNPLSMTETGNEDGPSSFASLMAYRDASIEIPDDRQISKYSRDTRFRLRFSRDKVLFGSQGVCDECMDSHAYAVIISGASGILHLPHISCDCTPKKT